MTIHTGFSKQSGILHLLFSGLFLAVLGLNSVSALPQESMPLSVPDSSIKSGSFSIQLQYRTIPDFSRGYKRYHYTEDFTELGRSADINYPVQKFAENHPEASLEDIYSAVLQEDIRQQLFSHLEAWYVNTITDKELLRAAWRNEVIRITTDADLEEAITEGTAAMMNHGFDDLTNDLLPFVSMLMEEQRYYHFDHSRISIFGEGVKGKVSVTEIMEALKSMDNSKHAGVCRDVQNAGLLMMRSLCDYYYSNRYPNAHINPDDYLFLQSWVTNSGQHVTTTLIDPFDRNTQYELDWGKVIVKSRQEGYDNGRQYGTVYRIWKYNNRKGYTAPVDFRKTQSGNLLDELVLTDEEQFSINGVSHQTDFSDLRAEWKRTNGNKFILSLGQMAQQQSFLSGSFLTTAGIIRSRFIEYTGKFIVQAIAQEDHIRRTSYLPRETFSFSGSFLIQPRYLMQLSAKPFFNTNGLSLKFYTDGMLEALWLINRNSGEDEENVHMSGDAGLYLSPGFRFDFQPEGSRIHSYLKLHSRYYVVANEIAYMAPNPFVLIPKATLVNPAAGVSAGVDLQNLNNRCNLLVKLEYTNMKCMFGSLQAQFQQSIPGNATASMGIEFNHQLSGPLFFWYPAEKYRVDAGLSLDRLRLMIRPYISLTDRADYSTGISASMQF